MYIIHLKFRRHTGSACRAPTVLLSLRTCLISDPLYSDPPSFSLSEPLILLTLRAQGEVLPPLPWPRLGWSRLLRTSTRNYFSDLFDSSDFGGPVS